MQSDDFIEVPGLLTVIPISSQVSKKGNLDVLIRKSAKNRLMKDSVVKIKQVSSFDQRRFIKLIGVAEKSTMRKVATNLQTFLAL